MRPWQRCGSVWRLPGWTFERGFLRSRTIWGFSIARSHHGRHPKETLTETPGTIPMRRRTRRHLRWLVPVAASAALFVGIGIWQLALQPGSDVRSLEAGLDLWIGYSEFGSGQRGPSELRAGTTAKIMFSLPRPAYHSILLLDGSGSCMSRNSTPKRT